MSAYPTTTQMSSAITQEVSSKFATLTLSTSASTSGGQTTSTIKLKSGSTDLGSSVTVSATTAAQAATIAADAVNGITLSVTNGASSSTIKLKNGNVEIASGTIQFTGVVTFTDLSTAQTTTSINGANIRTGTISADRIDVDSLKVKTIYGEGTYSSYIMMASSGKTIYIGGDRSTYSYETVYIKATDKVLISSWGNSSYGLTIDSGSSSGAMYPNANSWNYSLGTSTNGFYYLYIRNIYVRQSQGTGVLVIDSSQKYIRPDLTTGNNWSIGTSTCPFYDGYFKNISIGESAASSQISFFGAARAFKKTLSTTSQNQSYTAATASNYLIILNNIAGILKGYGLIGT